MAVNKYLFFLTLIVCLLASIERYRAVYSCFDKGCPTEKHESVRDNTERHDGLCLFTVGSSSSRVFSTMEGGAVNICLRVLKRNKMDSELLTCLLKFIEYFPDYLSALSRTLLRFFGQPLSKHAAVFCQNNTE